MDKNQNEAQGQAELELNDDQIARNDEVCNAVFELCKVLTENQELVEHGVPSIHFYSIGAVDSIKEVAKLVY